MVTKRRRGVGSPTAMQKTTISRLHQPIRVRLFRSFEGQSNHMLKEAKDVLNPNLRCLRIRLALEGKRRNALRHV